MSCLCLIFCEPGLEFLGIGNCISLFVYRCSIPSVPGGKVNILGGHSIGHSKQKSVYVHVSYSERVPR
jgi:hypothetical protein